MKLIYRTGDIFDLGKESHCYIAHGCNAQGVMGAGFAKLIKERVPEAYNSYINTYKANELRLGGVILGYNQDYMIFNLITQEKYGVIRENRYVSYDAIATCFEQLNRICKLWQVSEVRIPKIGAGLGNGNWNIISTIIEESTPDVQIVVYTLN